jgi:hypothetical protein
MRLLDPRDEFDKCVVGVLYDADRAVYDTELVLETFMRINEWSYEEALEWFEYNVLRSLPYFEDAPVFMNKDFDLDAESED